MREEPCRNRRGSSYIYLALSLRWLVAQNSRCRSAGRSSLQVAVERRHRRCSSASATAWRGCWSAARSSLRSRLREDIDGVVAHLRWRGGGKSRRRVGDALFIVTPLTRSAAESAWGVADVHADALRRCATTGGNLRISKVWHNFTNKKS